MTEPARAVEPLYARVTRDLAEAIARGDFPEGSLLPTEVELCARFGVSRSTMRAAMEELRSRGMISRRAGIGTRVEARRPRDAFVHESDSIESILQFTDGLEFRLVETHRMVAAKGAAAWLGCHEGERLLLLRGLRIGPNGPPVALSAHHVRQSEADFARRAHGLTGSLARALESETGRRIAAIRQTIEPALLVERDAALLEAPAGEAALSTWCWYLDEAGDLLLASHSLFPRGRYVWSQIVRRRPPGAAG